MIQTTDHVPQRLGAAFLGERQAEAERQQAERRTLGSAFEAPEGKAAETAHQAPGAQAPGVAEVPGGEPGDPAGMIARTMLGTHDAAQTDAPRDELNDGFVPDFGEARSAGRDSATDRAQEAAPTEGARTEPEAERKAPPLGGPGDQTPAAAAARASEAAARPSAQAPDLAAKTGVAPAETAPPATDPKDADKAAHAKVAASKRAGRAAE